MAANSALSSWLHYSIGYNLFVYIVHLGSFIVKSRPDTYTRGLWWEGSEVQYDTQLVGLVCNATELRLSSHQETLGEKLSHNHVWPIVFIKLGSDPMRPPLSLLTPSFANGACVVGLLPLYESMFHESN